MKKSTSIGTAAPVISTQPGRIRKRWKSGAGPAERKSSAPALCSAHPIVQCGTFAKSPARIFTPIHRGFSNSNRARENGTRGASRCPITLRSSPRRWRRWCGWSSGIGDSGSRSSPDVCADAIFATWLAILSDAMAFHNACSLWTICSYAACRTAISSFAPCGLLATNPAPEQQRLASAPRRRHHRHPPPQRHSGCSPRIRRKCIIFQRTTGVSPVSACRKLPERLRLQMS